MTTLDTLRIRCETSLKKSLDTLARKQQRTMSNLALHILTEYVRSNTEEPDVAPLSTKCGAITPEQLRREMEQAGITTARAPTPKGRVSYSLAPQENTLLNDCPLPKPIK